MILTRPSFVICLLLIAGTGTVRAEPSTETPTKVVVQRLPEGGLQPQVAVDEQGVVHRIYFKGDPRGGDLFYSRSLDQGTTFSSPFAINHHPGSAIAVGNIRGAQLALGKKGRVHVAWNGSAQAQPRGPQGGTPLLYTRLNEASTAFEMERNLIQRAVGLDGGSALAADSMGNVLVAWHAPQPGTQGEANRRIWVSRSHDDGHTFASEQAVSPAGTGVCGCCGMRAYADPRGTVYLLYRSATATIHRDMYLLRAPKEATDFTGGKLHDWTTGICPMSSAAFAADRQHVWAAWETDGQVYFAGIDPIRGQWTAPQSPPGAGHGRKHPVLAVNGQGERILAWTEGMGWNRGGRVAWQVYDREGKPTSEVGHAGDVPVWSLVAVFPRSDGRFVIVY